MNINCQSSSVGVGPLWNLTGFILGRSCISNIAVLDDVCNSHVMSRSQYCIALPLPQSTGSYLLSVLSSTKLPEP